MLCVHVVHTSAMSTGDVIRLREWDNMTCTYTGRELYGSTTHVTAHTDESRRLWVASVRWGVRSSSPPHGDASGSDVTDRCLDCHHDRSLHSHGFCAFCECSSYRQ